MEKRTKRNGFRLGILMLCTVMLLFAVMPTGVLADEDGVETYPITFSVTPENATIKLYKNSSSGAYGDPIQPNENGVYNIPFGQYRYIISADGYVTANKTFNATDTSLKNNNYVIEVSLKDMTDTILSDAYRKLFGKSGKDVFLTEFSGQNGDVWDIDSNYQDKNVIDYEYVMLNSKSGDKFKDVEISISGISFNYYYYDEDFSEVADYSVIDELGDIHYGNVNSENGFVFVMDDDDYSYGYGYDDDDEDEEPKSLCAAYVVEFELSMNGKTYDDTIEVTFIVPEHIFTRQERLEQAYEYLMDSYLGHNPSKDKVTENLNLQNLQNDDTYEGYYIVSTWESTDTSVIKDDGTVIRPDYDKNVTLNLEMFYARNIVAEPTAWLLDPGPLDDCEIKESITVTVKGTLGEKEPDPLPIIMFNSLTFDTNGGTAVSTVRSMQWSTIDLSSYTTEKEGYVFTGWYLDAECTKPCDKVTMDRNITVYAGWEKIAEFPYTDVTADEWFFDDVRYVWDNGLIDGVTEDTFEPEANVTRAVLIEALWRAEGRPEAESAGLFTDVAEDNAFAGAIAWAKETGIANGYDDGRFGIDDVVTREQTAAFLYRYAQYKKMDVSVGEDTNILSFDDIDTASEYAIPALCWACGADILRGDGNGCLRPADTVTRAELSAQLNRFIEAAR